MRAIPAKETVRLNVMPAIGFLAVIAGGVAINAVLRADRLPPIEFIDGRIIPDRVHPGMRVGARLEVNWRRLCRGTVSRELLDSENQVRRYKAYVPPLPTQLGPQTVMSEFWAFSSLPQGRTIYRAIMRFDGPDCGFTARWRPIEVAVPSLAFEVLAK